MYSISATSSHLRASHAALSLITVIALLVMSVSSAAADTVEVVNPPSAASAPSMMLHDGIPTIAVWDVGGRDLAVIRCDDPNCAPGGEIVTRPDTEGMVGANPSLALAGDGNPVVSYFDSSNQSLKVLHCDDLACADGGDTATTVDTGNVGLYSSIALADDGNPVVAYVDLTAGSLKVLRCDDPACAPGGDSIQTVDGEAGLFMDLVLDSTGNPVIAYHGEDNSLKVVHCDDRACVPDGNSLTVPDPSDVGRSGVSLALDGEGNPVVAYDDAADSTLLVLHCDDADCAPGGDTISRADVGGKFPSMGLDTSGNPVIAHGDAAGQHLRLLRCNDPSCAGNDDARATPTRVTIAGQLSLQLDASDIPTVAYTRSELRVLQCDDPGCNAAPTATRDNYLGTEDTPIIEAAPGVLSNDTDSDSSILTATVVTQPTKGAVVMDPNGGFTYTPDANTTGIDSFTYEVSDGFGTDRAIVDLVVRSVNDAPVAVDDAVSGPFETAIEFDLVDGSAGGQDSDVDVQQDLRIVDLTSPANGRVFARTFTAVRYVPDSGFSGVDTFSYTVSDGQLTDTATVTVTIDPPLRCDGLIVTIDMNTNGGIGNGTSGGDVILGTPGDDMIDAGDGNDTVCAGDGDDTVIGGSGDDVLIGGEGRDIMRGNSGVDRLEGEAGNDRLLGGTDGDTLIGGDGDDYLGGFGGADTIVGGPGNERIFGGFGADTIDGGPGDDVIFGLIGNDTIEGGDGDDRLNGDRGRDIINGGPGNDRINGGNGDDILNGEAGNDSVNGGRADDQLSGGSDDDTCAGNKENVADTADASCEMRFGIP